jgi:uridylate kinase
MEEAGERERREFKRILLKLSGESLLGKREFGIDVQFITKIARVLTRLKESGTQVCVVVGGGNIWRGSTGVSLGMDQVTADYMGMLATVMNGLALQTALEAEGVQTRLQTAIAMHEVAEPYIQRKAIRHLEKGRIVIFSAGTGNPYFTTDTAAALRAAEVSADCLLKATKTDGVYTDDPSKNIDTKLLKKLTHTDVLSNNLKVIDGAAVSICRDNNIPIIVFGIDDPDNIYRVSKGEDIGSLIKGG